MIIAKRVFCFIYKINSKKNEGEKFHAYVSRCGERVMPTQSVKELLSLCTVPMLDFNVGKPYQDQVTNFYAWDFYIRDFYETVSL